MTNTNSEDQPAIPLRELLEDLEAYVQEMRADYGTSTELAWCHYAELADRIDYVGLGLCCALTTLDAAANLLDGNDYKALAGFGDGDVANATRQAN